jgi:3-deoxy-manno-octulosonate cytidylyltransferase (CMP-KDO synthetase)
MKNVIIIPSRLKSVRLPNKPLIDINGKTMIEIVYENAIKSNIGDVFVACDDIKIKNKIKNIGGKAIMTDINISSGTDRIYQALQKIENNDQFQYIINLQGDIPIIDTDIIKKALKSIENSKFDIATLATKIKDKKDINDPNIVKIAISFKGDNFGEALYFSRSPIPFSRSDLNSKTFDSNSDFYEHIGIYVYKRSSLEKFINIKESNLEKIEKLEQLRALENNMRISVDIVDSRPNSIDTKDDLEKVKKYLKI